MKLNIKSQSAFWGFCAVTALLSGCNSTGSGYFAAMPSTATSSNDTTNTPIGGAPSGPVSTVNPSPTQTPVALPSSFVPNGILNGHFDVDTATSNMPFPISGGTVTYHVHEYDKQNKTTTVDFFNLIEHPNSKYDTPVSGTQFDQIQETIANQKRFYLVIVNAGLNPGAVLEINGSILRGTDYHNLTQQLLSSGVRPFAYTIGVPQVSGDVQLQSLKIAFDSTVTANALLVPTAPTDCVFPNIPGKLGEYRDGALAIQALDANSIVLNSSTGAAAENGGLIWEGLIYNHFMRPGETNTEICY